MKKLKITSLCFLVVFTVLFSGCKQKTEKEHSFDCKSLTDKKAIYEIAKSIIIDRNNENVCSIWEIDTTDFFIIEDYFTNSETKNRLVFIGGTAGLASGTARNLLILFSCTDTLNVIWSGQVGQFSQTDIIDVDRDGIKEIIMNAGWAYMGEIGHCYEIFNFKDGKRNSVFRACSLSVIDEGAFFNHPEFYKRGDTLENNFDCSLIKLNDAEYGVRQIRSVIIHNGGQTEQEVLKKMKRFSDTIVIKLK